MIAERRVKAWREVIEPDWTAWCVVQHLLPTHGLVALAEAISENALRGSEFKLHLHIKVADHEAGGVMVDLDDHTNAPQSVVDFVRYLFWRNDSLDEVLRADSNAPHGKAIGAAASFCLVGAAEEHEMGAVLEAAKKNQAFWTASMRSLLDAVEAGLLGYPGERVEGLPAELSIFANLMLIGRYARADEWGLAKEALVAQDGRLPLTLHPALRVEFDLLDSVFQSLRAWVEWNLDPKQVIRPPAHDRNQEVLLKVNYSQDILQREVLAYQIAGGTHPSDPRPAHLQPTLVASTHRDMVFPAYPHGGSRIEKALVKIESILRRQIAIGAAHDSDITRTFLIQHLVAVGMDASDPAALRRLLGEIIVVGRPDVVSQIPWHELQPARILQVADIENLYALVRRWPGPWFKRARTFTVLLVALTESTGDLAPELSRAIITKLLELAQNEVTLWEEINVGGAALDGLIRVLRNRPGASAQFSDEIANLVVRILSGVHDWTGYRRGLELGTTVIADLSPESLARVVGATLTFIAPVASARNMGNWHLVRPATALLSSAAVHSACSDTAQEGEILDLLAGLLVGGQGQVDAVVVLLGSRWLPRLAQQPQFRLGAEALAASLVSDAEETNSTGATDAQRAVLALAAVVGGKAVTHVLSTAIQVLEDVAARGRVAVAFSTIAGVLLTWEREAANVAAVVEPEVLRTLISRLEVALTSVWKSAVARPSIFAGWGIPRPTDANLTIVQNLALASYTLAQRFELSGVSDAITSASTSTALGIGVLRARAVFYAFGRKGENAPSDPVASNDADAFYSTLPFGLGTLGALSASELRETTSRLAGSALRFGPRMEDAAIWSVLTLHHLDVDQGLLRSYHARVLGLPESDRTRILLEPLMWRLREK